MSDTKKWTSAAGPIMNKRVTEALNAITQEGRSHSEKWGVIGLDEQESSFYSPFSPPRPEAIKASTDIGEKFKWEITRENYQEIIAAAVAAAVELRKTRPVDDKRVTPEADLARKAAATHAHAEVEAKEQAKAAEVAARAAELRTLYPWANSDAAVRQAVRAAGNVKTELSRAFPGINFSVRADGYDAVRVKYEFGPTPKEVQAFTNKYRNGEFDGQSDSFNYDHSIIGEALNQVLGRVRYMNVSREFPSDTYIKIGQLLCASKGLTYAGMSMRNLTGELDSEELSTHVHRLLHRTSFPAGAVIAGIADEGAERETWSEQMLAKYGTGWASHDKRATMAAEDLAKLQDYESKDNLPDGGWQWCRITFVEPKTPRPAILPDGPTNTPNRITISYNAEKNGVEIKFDAKPEKSVLERLKDPLQKWRYYSPSRVWYKRYTPETWRWAHEFAGLPLAPAPTEETPGPDRFDMQVEDNMAQACQ